MARSTVKRLAFGLFLLLWCIDIGDTKWLTLLTGTAGSCLTLAALWRLRDAGPSFRQAFW